MPVKSTPVLVLVTMHIDDARRQVPCTGLARMDVVYKSEILSFALVCHQVSRRRKDAVYRLKTALGCSGRPQLPQLHRTPVRPPLLEGAMPLPAPVLPVPVPLLLQHPLQVGYPMRL